jgi:hypothetical protein
MAVTGPTIVDKEVWIVSCFPSLLKIGCAVADVRDRNIEPMLRPGRPGAWHVGVSPLGVSSHVRCKLASVQRRVFIMDHQVSCEPKGQYLLARVSGPYDPAILRELFTIVRDKAREGKFNRILLDGSGVAPAPSEVTRYLVGEVFAELFPSPIKIAAIYLHAPDKFTENTAAIRGTNILITPDESEALKWLLADDASSQ